MASGGHDGVVSSLHIFDGGRSVVSLNGIRACFTCVVLVEPESMGPTVECVQSIIGNDGGCAGHRVAWCQRWGSVGLQD